MNKLQSIIAPDRLANPFQDCSPPSVICKNINETPAGS